MNSNGNHQPGDLSTRAMLCGLSISTWGNRRQDKQISREAAASRGLGERVGRYNRWLLIQDESGTPVREYGAIITARDKAYSTHRELTLPWMEDGLRINSVANFNNWCVAIRSVKNEFESALEHFIKQYPDLVTLTKCIMDSAALREGKQSMFNRFNYPSQSELRRKFQFSDMVLPIPQSSDFRVDLSDSQVASIRQQIEYRKDVWLVDATQHLLEKLDSLVKRVVHLSDPKATIQSALVRDIEQVCSVVESLNITNDKDLSEFTRRIRTELAIDPVLIKTSNKERENLAARASQIQSDMSGFMIGGSDEL